MHIALVIAGGIVQLGICVLFGWLWGGSAAAMALAARCFIPLWMAVVAVNMWVGVAHAGYTVQQEAPILLLNMAVPVALALFLAWKLSQG